ncbi:MAG: LacI family transcriptional regulator, partial [Marmoricola sp.]|nr:LacI family transcriptional regulator [Marmoricola sp.]
MSQHTSRPDVQRNRHHQTPPTLATVADEAGVSRQTVSNALNNPDLLRPETLERVQSVIERLGYSPNRAARQLRSGASHLIGLRFEPAQEGTSNALMDRFLHTLVETASRTGHHVLLFSGNPQDPLDGYEDLLRSTAVDAFVVTDTYAGTPQSGFLQDRGAPFVTFGRPWDEPAADHAWIDVDGAHGARIATEHLLEHGHRRIAWLGWEKTSRIGQDRRSGWEAAMRAAGVETAGLGVRL